MKSLRLWKLLVVGITKFVLTVFLSLMCISESSAQMPIGYEVDIGGISINCRDPFGNAVMNYAAPINQAAMATVINGGPAILMNTQLMKFSSTEFNVFTYAHECAHHYLGHVVNASFVPQPQHELDADCMAAKTTRDFGWLPPQNFDVAMQTLYTYQEDANHPPGPYRVQHAYACYQNMS